MKARLAHGSGPADRRALWHGFGDGMTQAIEMVVTPALFAFLGIYVDGRLGTAPVFAVVLTVFAVAGAFLRAYYRYAAGLDEIQAGRPWRRGEAGIS